MEKREINIHGLSYVAQLFDEMAQTYGLVNYVSSFGFSERWRRQCAEQIKPKSGDIVFDLMSGMGEMWPSILRRAGDRIRIVAFDLSAAMVGRSLSNRPNDSVAIVRTNALKMPAADASADVVVSSFGLKTFSPAQQMQLAEEIKRVLKPGGTYSLLEISVPANFALRALYMFYVKYVIPLIGRLFMGNADNYRMLGIYTERFSNCEWMCQCLRQVGLQAAAQKYFFGCATGIVGCKPNN